MLAVQVLNLSAPLAVGLILVSCCPGGQVHTFIIAYFHQASIVTSLWGLLICPGSFGQCLWEVGCCEGCMLMRALIVKEVRVYYSLLSRPLNPSEPLVQLQERCGCATSLSYEWPEPMQASNVATYIAHGDVALSVLMTTASTLGAIVMTPLLTKILAGTLVPVDAKVCAILLTRLFPIASCQVEAFPHDTSMCNVLISLLGNMVLAVWLSVFNLAC